MAAYFKIFQKTVRALRVNLLFDMSHVPQHHCTNCLFDRERGEGWQWESYVALFFNKIKTKTSAFSPVAIKILIVYQHTSCLAFLSQRHMVQFINIILFALMRCSLILQSQNERKIFNDTATILSEQIIQVIQNMVVFESS